MRKIFIDGGAHAGGSVQLFREEWQDANDFEIFSFEPNKQFEQELLSLNINYYDKIIWINNTSVDFYQFHQINTSQASSIIKGKCGPYTKKFQRRNGEIIQKEAIDFDEFIKNNFNINDLIILKLDIEGAEYDVLEHMIAMGSVHYINDLYIDWHYTKTSGEISLNRHNMLVEDLLKNSIEPKHWDAICKNVDK